MGAVERIDECNKERFIKHISQDVIKHVFARYDIQYDPEHTTIHAVMEKNDVRGYILLYSGTDAPSIVLECDEETAETLIAYTPENHFVMHAPTNMLAPIERRFPNAKIYVENWMLLEKENAKFVNSKLAKRLSTEEDAVQFAQLVLNKKDRPNSYAKKYIDWIAKMPVYGVFIDGVMVSYAGSFIQMPQIWMIGGVYTDPKHRNKGYALLATSAITKEALEKAEMAALFVRSDNNPAISVYEKIGYRKIGEKLWVDVGTGLKP